MSSFIVHVAGSGPRAQGGDPEPTRVAVKDLIDMAGLTTTCGSRVVAGAARPATVDADCLAGIRAAAADGQAVIVGKTNLHELAFGVSGINPWYGTPTNPLDARLVPGGSSSGSAAAVGAGQADVALGSDTGGSIRIPAACCGVTGLKTTRGRISLKGVAALGPSLDTVGPLALTVAGTGLGMQLLEPGFEWVGHRAAARIGRFRPRADPWVDRAVDAALARWSEGGPDRVVLDIDLPGFAAATDALAVVLAAEAWQVHGELWRAHAEDLSPDVAQRLEAGSRLAPDTVSAARAQGRRWATELADALRAVDLIALPVLAEAPPRLEDAARVSAIRYTGPFNLSGGPALALPAWTTEGALPASLQLAARHDEEATLLATAGAIETATDAVRVRRGDGP